MSKQPDKDQGLVHPQHGVEEHAQGRKWHVETTRDAGSGARGGWPWPGRRPLTSSGLDQAMSGVWPGRGHHDQGLAQPFGWQPRDTQEAS